MARRRLVILIPVMGLVLALPAAAHAADPTISMEGSSFVPADVTVAVGESVTWVNRDAAFHDAAAVDGSWTTPKLWTNQEASITFDTAGTFAYRCTLHPSMRATLSVVAPAPDTDTSPTGTGTHQDGPAGLVLLAGLIGALIGARRFRRSAVSG